MPSTNKNLKPQYEGKKENLIRNETVTRDNKKEISDLSRIIDENRKLEENFKNLE